MCVELNENLSVSGVHTLSVVSTAKRKDRRTDTCSLLIWFREENDPFQNIKNYVSEHARIIVKCILFLCTLCTKYIMGSSCLSVCLYYAYFISNYLTDCN
jgi:hypothetical protein